MTTGSASLADPTSLLGEWRLSRVIDDRLAGERSLVGGMLSLTAVSPDRIRWEEQGHWHQPAGDVAVRRGLWLVRDEGSQGWWVRFEDDRDFHPWLPGEAVVHPCAPDTYRGVVHGTPERWTVEWEVTGPAKDYSMSTELTREV
ncbi:MAG: hypothetical protein JWQ93_3187 [Marmoricola sp.]|nr:hypothetical protein [Marmoricola sp.]